MAIKAAAVKEAVAKARPNFQVGGTNVFLPNHVITMLPPRRIKSPYFATFQVPLRFNKLDLRDYLYHAYGVEVRNVHVWLTPQSPQRRHDPPDQSGKQPDLKDSKAYGRGVWYRPQPIKRMMVELVKPFAFPEAPPKPTKDMIGTDDDPRIAWDYSLNQSLTTQQKIIEKDQDTRMHQRKYPLREEMDIVPSFRVSLAKQARELVSGKRVWRSTAKLDERWEALTEKKTDADKPTGSP